MRQDFRNRTSSRVDNQGSHSQKKKKKKKNASKLCKQHKVATTSWVNFKVTEAGGREEGSVIFRELTRVKEDSELI